MLEDGCVWNDGGSAHRDDSVNNSRMNDARHGFFNLARNQTVSQCDNFRLDYPEALVLWSSILYLL